MSKSQEIPWGRVSVEAVAIVASILLAFAIDAWWDERNVRIEESDILQSLLVEFEVNREEAVSVIQNHETGLQSTVRLMSLSNEQILALSSEEIEGYLRFFANPRTFDAVRGSVDALTSSGKLGILRSRELRQALTTFINILEDAVEDRQYMFQWSMIVWSEVARNGGPYRKRVGNRTAAECVGLLLDSACYISESMAYLPAATPQDLLRLRQNTTLMGYVNRGKENSVRYASEIRKAQNQIEYVIELIEKSLKPNTN